ncbi:type I deoxyribonuclease HsdR, partial [candidate division MSBL1 archaeon SCGC-AAA259E17]
VKYKEKIEQIDEAPETEVVITNPEEFIDDPEDEETLKKRFKDDEDSLKLVVVCEKWTTGFDVPCLHTMYIDRPMKNHNLMQTIGRVNRTYKDKPAGLIVDYIGIGENLREAMDKYTSDIREQAMQDIDFAIGAMKKQHQKVKSFFEHTDYEGWEEKQGLELQRLVHQAENEVLETKEKEEKFKDAVKQLKKSYSLVSPHKEALKIRSDVVFFEAVKENIEKPIGREERYVEKEEREEAASAMKELISEGISVKELVEIVGFETGKRKHVLSDDFLQEVQDIEYENVQVKLLEKLIRNEIADRKKRNLAKYKDFEERLEETIGKYHQNFLTTKEVFNQLMDYANELGEEADRTERLGLSEEELAFYDAISEEGDIDIEETKLKEIATEIKRRLKEKSKAVDWTKRKKIKNEMKSEVKRYLRKQGFSHKEYEPLVDPIVDQARAFYGEQAIGIA